MISGVDYFLILLILLVIGVALWRILHIRSQIVYEYQRGVLYVRGRFRRVLEPGRYWVSGARSIVTVDTRPVFITIPGQEVLSSDGVTVRISLAAQYQVGDPDRAINKAQSYAAALYLLLQMEARSLISTQKIDAILENRDNTRQKLLESVSPKAAELGITLLGVDVKDLMLPGDIKKVFAQVVKAQKEGQAALERARGETAALRNLANAAKMIEENPNLLQLRALQVIAENSSNSLVLNVSGGNIIPANKIGNPDKGNQPNE